MEIDQNFIFLIKAPNYSVLVQSDTCFSIYFITRLLKDEETLTFDPMTFQSALSVIKTQKNQYTFSTEKNCGISNNKLSQQALSLLQLHVT
jgi:hypothetical protein